MAISDWTTDPYPKPRGQRGTASSAPAAAPESVAPRAPRTRFFSFHLGIAPARVGRTVSPKYRGPAILKDVVARVKLGGSITTSDILVQLAILTAPQSNLLQVVPAENAGGQDFVDSTFAQSGATLPALRPGFYWTSTGTGMVTPIAQPLDYVVYEREFFVRVVLRNTDNVNQAELDGVLRVYEDCDPEALVLLMS